MPNWKSFGRSWGWLCACSVLIALALAPVTAAQPDAEDSALPVEADAPTAPVPPWPAPGEPVRVTMRLTLNKISEIDTVAETYRVDAYLYAEWRDEVGARILSRPNEERTLYLDDATGELLGRVIWWPDLELVNTVGGRDVGDTRVEVSDEGRILYTERFQAQLSSNMDFRRYPFDEQLFEIRFESFTYAREDMVFVDPQALFGHLKDTPLPDWHLAEPAARVSQYEYSDGWYSRYTFCVEGSRLPGYFVWQVFLPLFLIMGTSWIVFWLQALSDKISVAFTCLLTLVAFNFYTATLLPQLPYNTFIEVVVISAYVATFTLIAWILVADRLVINGRIRAADRMLRTGRWLFPLGYAASLLTMALSFF